ncbi:hypothetical protein QWI17_18775 [Gilvimarinus sp. SDUM040013]|uniref:Uncharacterized protein n=1 Tax=Gilvimarinus gilvus TaxID=3058038 RepID=A0ABU4RYN0_9GAMM|nr:hypothetical protein [Gilvimarinus sp. SDUM040013]MDO3387896.1 hypothetical protein [Gilvimarinus sp. SDUM040013]MDX6848733.1 hypothetical protein [Gilvimarinus sp. SDUM040013]
MQRCIQPLTRGKGIAKLAQGVQLLLLCLLLSLPSQSLVADSFSDRRAHVGIKLFRTLLAAEQNVTSDAGDDIYFVYVTDQTLAEQHALQFNESTAYSGTPPAKTIALDAISHTKNFTPRALFISQKLNSNELATVVHYTIEQHIISFSPYEGDVEGGVLGGLSVEATIKPLINITTLESSGIDIKSFYLKVAKRHE